MPSAKPTWKDRLYGRRWKAEARHFLSAHPLCLRCSQLGEIVAAEVVDHIRPHKGDLQIFWDRDNWQPLCKTCHDRKTSTEDGGLGRGGVKPATKSADTDTAVEKNGHGIS